MNVRRSNPVRDDQCLLDKLAGVIVWIEGDEDFTVHRRSAPRPDQLLHDRPALRDLAGINVWIEGEEELTTQNALARDSGQHDPPRVEDLAGVSIWIEDQQKLTVDQQEAEEEVFSAFYAGDNRSAMELAILASRIDQGDPNESSLSVLAHDGWDGVGFSGLPSTCREFDSEPE